MKQVLVAGYGNSLRSDDAVGLFAVRELQKAISSPNVEFLELPQLQLELAETLSQKDLVIFIDAAMHGISGEINFEPLLPKFIAEKMSHSTDPETLLGVSKELYGRAPQAMLATVAGECFGFGTQLSPEVEVSMRGLAVRVRMMIEEFLGQTASA